MNKLANLHVRNWSERMSPNFNMGSRQPQPPMPPMMPHHHHPHPQQPPQHKVTPHGVPPIAQPPPMNTPVHYSFNVPFASDLAGPNTEDILHATTDAVLRWTHPETAPDDVPIHELPVHAQNLANLRQTCKEITGSNLEIEAHVVTTLPKNVKGQVTTVYLAGGAELVYKTRDLVLNSIPLSLVRAMSPLKLRYVTVAVFAHLE